MRSSTDLQGRFALSTPLKFTTRYPNFACSNGAKLPGLRGRCRCCWDEVRRSIINDQKTKNLHNQIHLSPKDERNQIK